MAPVNPVFPFPTMTIHTMKRSALVLTALCALMGAAQAQENDTLKKIKDSGTATMGVRESSGALS